MKILLLCNFMLNILFTFSFQKVLLFLELRLISNTNNNYLYYKKYTTINKYMEICNTFFQNN